MRYPAAEKLEIIRIVQQSHLPVKQTLDRLGIPRPTFYRWYDRFLTHGVEGLEDRHSAPSRVWNRIPDDVRSRIIDMALDQTELSPRELGLCRKLETVTNGINGYNVQAARISNCE